MNDVTRKDYSQSSVGSTVYN